MGHDMHNRKSILRPNLKSRYIRDKQDRVWFIWSLLTVLVEQQAEIR